MFEPNNKKNNYTSFTETATNSLANKISKKDELNHDCKQSTSYKTKLEEHEQEEKEDLNLKISSIDLEDSFSQTVVSSSSSPLPLLSTSLEADSSTQQVINCSSVTSINDTDLNNNNNTNQNRLKNTSTSINSDSITINRFRTQPISVTESSPFDASNVLASQHHAYTKNFQSPFSSFFYTSTTKQVLNKFVMSYEEQLYKAIEKGNYELCNELLIKSTTSDGKKVTPCCNVNAQFNRRYPLGLACELNYYEICELLIRHGANVNQIDFFDQSSLLYATYRADLNIVQLLCQNGADLNKADSNGEYPLHVAIVRRHDAICEYLLENGASIDATDKQGCSALAIAIVHDYYKMAFKLIELGADTNLADNNGDTPLIKSIWSTSNSDTEKSQVVRLVRTLVEHGADVNARNETGRTALFTAIYQNHTEIALYLIENGAKCELEDVIMSNFTLLHYACFQGNYVLTKALLEKKCNPNAIASSCESPVYIAVIKGYLDIVSLLVEYGANVNLFIGSDGDNKCTALQAAVYYINDYNHFRQIVNKLIEGNADLSIAEPGPILFNCLQYNKSDFAKYLVSVGADVEQRTVFNQSCFYKAFLTKNIEFMHICIMAGFDLTGESWINEYLENPDFIEYTDYYVKRASGTASTPTSSNESSRLDLSNVSANSEEITELMNKSNQEISDLLDMDEYYFERFHLLNQRNRRMDKKQNTELARKIYTLIRHTYTNPLSLKELARIKIRRHLLEKDYQLKFKVENDLPLPKRLKDYLLFKEFIV